jgi:hypothetical protein
MLAFCIQSLFREYGWQFFWRVVVPHPVRTAKAVIGATALDFSGEMAALSTNGTRCAFGGAQSIVGLGFCLKPMNPPCPSGRSNHDCDYLEKWLCSEAKDIPESCQHCAIREIGTLTLRAGASFYIMTSARDILFDLFTPALAGGRFTSGLFLLCRYSLRPFAVGLLASGIRSWLFPFDKGDCRDYRTWIQADRGVKDEQTGINELNRKAISELLAEAVRAPQPATQFERRGNVLYPRVAPERR